MAPVLGPCPARPRGPFRFPSPQGALLNASSGFRKVAARRASKQVAVLCSPFTAQPLKAPSCSPPRVERKAPLGRSAEMGPLSESCCVR